MVTESNNNSEDGLFEGRQFDSPLIFPGGIDHEPERYIAEKPFDLTRFEYSILKKPISAEFWFTLVAGGTGGMALTVIGKLLYALIMILIMKSNDTKLEMWRIINDTKLEVWEIITVIIGILFSLYFKKCFKSDDDKEKIKLMKAVDKHFNDNRLRHVHLTQGRTNEN